MKALLDTHAFLWWVLDKPELSKTARDFIVNSNVTIQLHPIFERSGLLR